MDVGVRDLSLNTTS